MLIDFEKVTINPAFRKSYEDTLGNWNVLHEAIRHEERIPVILALLKLELETKRRLQIVTRLLSAYHTLARNQNQTMVIDQLGKRKAKR